MGYTKEQLIQRIREVAAQYGIDPAVAVEQLRRESAGFADRYVYGPGTSPVGAQGLAQFMPGTWQTYGRGGNPFDPDDALQAYGRYMSKLLSQFGGRYDIALAGYNSGENRKEYANAAAQGRAINWAIMPAGVQKETKPYVEAILANAQKKTTTATCPTCRRALK